VLNLLVNAVDAARDKAAHGQEVDVAVEAVDGRARVEVLDRGPGIPPAVRDRLFEPFHSTKAKGHGLGLAIARTLTRAHGGDVELQDGPGGVGTRAVVWLPIETPQEGS
jgi:signal transduction histidine kinase